MPLRQTHESRSIFALYLRKAIRLLASAVSACVLTLSGTAPALARAAHSKAALPKSNGGSRLAPASKDLQIYFVDVEGGQATLFVTPDGESLLIDTGWSGNNGRDANRIVASAKKAGLSKINYVLITHFHEDHVGGVPQLVARFPVDTFIDHGENRETSDARTVQDWQEYQKVLATGKYKHIVAKPADVLPIQGIEATVVSSDAATITDPLPGAGQDNPACKDSPKYPTDQTENRRSLGTLIKFGKLRILDLGDLTHDEEAQLMCPVNKLGKIDIYIVSHHGWDQSSSPALVYGIAPRVAIMDNGAKKGGTPSVWTIIEKSPGLEDLWQVHFSEEGGSAHNVAPEYIANPDGPDAGNYLELIAHPDGSFTVFNSRTGKSKDYAAAAGAAKSVESDARPGSEQGKVELLTPTQGVNFAPYISKAVGTIKGNWSALLPEEARNGEKGAVAIQFRINPDGKVNGATVEKSCGVEALDKAALDAVNASSPLDPQPAEFHGPNIELRLTFTYNVPI